MINSQQHRAATTFVLEHRDQFKTGDWIAVDGSGNCTVDQSADNIPLSSYSRETTLFPVYRLFQQIEEKLEEESND